MARHYWLLVTLLLNVFATGVLLYVPTLGGLARAARTAGDAAQVGNPSPVLHAAGALVLLLAAMMLSVYKPRGLTGYGRRRSRASTPGAATPAPRPAG